MDVIRWKLSNLFAGPSVGVNDQKSFEHDLSEQIPKPETVEMVLPSKRTCFSGPFKRPSSTSFDHVPQHYRPTLLMSFPFLSGFLLILHRVELAKMPSQSHVWLLEPKNHIMTPCRGINISSSCFCYEHTSKRSLNISTWPYFENVSMLHTVHNTFHPTRSWFTIKSFN